MLFEFKFEFGHTCVSRGECRIVISASIDNNTKNPFAIGFAHLD